MIELRMLGEIRLLTSDGAEVHAVLRQPKRLALLAYLAMPQPGTWHRRDQLLALFWPELDTAHARMSLRNALYVLRQALGDQVIRTRGDDEVSIDATAMQTDVAETWRAISDDRPDEAVALYRGDLLPGLFPADSDGFQRWLDAERDRLRTSVARCALARMTVLERDGNASDALALAQRVLDIRLDDETLVRQVMILHERLGDRAGALAVFEKYRTRLAVEFEAEPAPETIAIAVRLRTVQPSALPASGESKPATTKREVEGTPYRDDTREREATRALDETPTRRQRAAAAPFRNAGIVSIGIIAIVAVIGVLALRPGHRLMPQGIGRSTPLTADEGLQVHASISPNGRLVAYARGTGKRLNILIQKIGGGVPWALTTDSLGFEELPRWSPDNDQLLFLSHNDAYVAPAIGGSASIVARGTLGDGRVRSASWSPTGDSILIVRNDSLLVQPLHGTRTRFVGRGKQLHSCLWSPRGTWIVCESGNWLAFEAGPLFGNEAPSAFVLFPASGGTPIALTDHEFQYRSPAWSADGAFLWFLSNRDGPSGEVYALRIGDDGRPIDEPIRIGLSAESISLSAGRIVYSVPVRRGNIWSTPLPGSTLLTLADARQVTRGTQLIELVCTSQDGKWIVYDSNQPGNADLFRVAIDGGVVEQLTNDPRPEYAGALSPNGEELAWQRFVNGDRHLFVKRLDADTAIELLPVKGDQGVPRWSPDGQSLAAWSHDNEEGAVFVLHRNASGAWQRPAWRLSFGQLPTWSPDGKTIAFVRYDGRIQAIPSDSGAVRTVYAPRPDSDDPIATYLLWKYHPDTILFVGHNARGLGGIWSIAARGGVPRLRVDLQGDLGKSYGPSLTGNANSLFFTVDERFSNVRIAELVKR